MQFIFTMHGHMLILAALTALVTSFPVDDVPSGEHIQHISMPLPYTTTESKSRIQTVPPTESSSKTRPTPATTLASVQSKSELWEQSSVPSTTPTGTTEGDITTDLSFAVEGDLVALPQPKENSDTGTPVDDLDTANFFWGLGPVYPHLYQFKRVPHLVPIHSWNPYHDYYVYHQKYPNVYKF